MLRLFAGGRAAVGRRFLTVLGIETSCDDTAVSIISSPRKVLSSVTFTNRRVQVQQGGISPSFAAEQHRNNLPRVLEQCLNEAQMDWSRVDAIAVTTTPGLVIALKEGIKCAISLAKMHQKDLIPVHHMRAHALAAFLLSEELKFPFVSVLISGGHALIVLAESPDKFKLLGASTSGSPGECLDKVARELKITEIPDFSGIHAGAAMEILAAKASPNGHLRYEVPGPSTSRADMNFSQLKASLLMLVRKRSVEHDFSMEDFCASIQYLVTRHICSRVNAALDGITNNSDIISGVEHIVVGGGVASNKYITRGISKVGVAYGLQTVVIPPRLCTDNAEMIALTGLLKYENRSEDICWWPNIPDTIYAHARSEIGEDVRSWIPAKPRKKLSGPSLHGDTPVRLYAKEDFHKD